MDLEYLKCLQNASHGPGLKTCMKTAKKFIINLKSHLQSSGHCKLIDCLPEKSDSRGNMCQDVDHLDRLTYYLVHLNSYLSKMSQKLTKCLSVSYIGDTNKKAFHMCLKNLTDDMHNFESKVTSVCGKSRNFATNESSKQLFASCQSSSKILQTAIHNVPSCSNIKVDLTPTTNINDCLQDISILEGQIGQCILQELLEVHDEEHEEHEEHEERGGAKQNKKKKKNRKDKKKTTVDCKNCSKYTPTGKITSCWQRCHPYNPLTDVHNPYYNFNKKCGHALDTNCDPNSPAYAVPPPLGF